MAVRLSIAFDTSAESWMNQQTQYDLWHAEQGRKRLRVGAALRRTIGVRNGVMPGYAVME